MPASTIRHRLLQIPLHHFHCFYLRQYQFELLTLIIIMMMMRLRHDYDYEHIIYFHEMSAHATRLLIMSTQYSHHT